MKKELFQDHEEKVKTKTKDSTKKRKASRDLTGLTAEQIKKIEKNKKKTLKQKEKKKLKMKEEIKNTFIYVTRFEAIRFSLLTFGL